MLMSAGRMNFQACRVIDNRARCHWSVPKATAAATPGRNGVAPVTATGSSR